MPGPALLDRTRDLVESMNAMAAELSRTVRVAENRQAFAGDGMATPQSWLRGHTRLSAPAASQVVRNGRAMEQLPVVAVAHAAGQITADAVTAIGRITAPRYLRLIEERDGDLAGIAAVLVQHATTEKHEELTKLVQTFLDRLDEDGPEPDPTEQRQFRCAKQADGRLFFRGELDAVGGEKFLACLESHVQADRPAGDSRTRSQQPADALVQWADNTPATGQAPRLRTVKPHVAVKVPLEDLLDPATGEAATETGFGTVISAARTRWVACDADITRIVLGPDGEPLDVGRRPHCRGPRRACEAWGAAGSFHSPAATPRTGGRKSITGSSGCTAARPPSTTARCSANATTPRSTTASASNATNEAAGT